MKRDDDEDEKKETPEQEMPGWIFGLNIFFRKYGSHMMLACSLLLLAFVGWRKYQQNKQAKEDESWVQLSDAQNKVNIAAHPGQNKNLTADFGDPAQALRSVASTTDVPSVRAQAYLMLGNYYLDAINLGHYGQTEKVDVADALKQAEAAFNKVATDFKDEPLYLLNARKGLARVAQDRNEWDTAASLYASIQKDAMAAGFPQMAAMAEDRAGKLAELRQPIALAPAAGVPSTQPLLSPDLTVPMPTPR